MRTDDIAINILAGLCTGWVLFQLWSVLVWFAS
jgi:hypothetical protein